MRIPTIRGVIDRRILVNFRLDAQRLAQYLPAPFEPLTVEGWGMGGVCLIRLKEIRPRGVPRFLGLRSENAAHRFAVTWLQGAERREGVYIPRRDTSLKLNAWVGGRIFPGVHHLSEFDVQEQEDEYRVGFRSPDGESLRVQAHLADDLPSQSVFSALSEASAFYESGSCGYSPGHSPGCFDGLELNAFQWKVEPLAVTEVESSFFGSQGIFAGAVEFDHALLMTGIEHEWHALEPLESHNLYRKTRDTQPISGCPPPADPHER